MTKTRTVKDSMGELEVPETACYGAQRQRAIGNCPVSGLAMPSAFLQALGRVKLACAEANHKIGGLDDERHQSISAICQRLIAGELDAEFPIDIFQTGSGTSTNMNANEVIATLASAESGMQVHPNDHVNMGHSSNDVFPAAIHVAASLLVNEYLMPALVTLQARLEDRKKELEKEMKDWKKKKKIKRPRNPNAKPGGLFKPTKISNQMCEFLGFENGSSHARTAVSKKLNEWMA